MPAADVQGCSSRVVFLDVDGVLHSRWATKSNYFQPDCMQALHELVDGLAVGTRGRSDVAIVLTSSWRMLQFQIDMLNDALQHSNIREPVGATPLRGYPTRSDEILSWLEQHPHVTSFVVLDDMDLSLPHKDSFTRFVVRTHEHKGLQKADVRQALEILRRPAVRSELPRAVEMAASPSSLRRKGGPPPPLTSSL